MTNKLPTKKDIYMDYLSEIEGLVNTIGSKVYNWKKEEREIYYLEQRILELEETARLYKPEEQEEKESYQPKYQLDNQFNAIEVEKATSVKKESVSINSFDLSSDSIEHTQDFAKLLHYLQNAFGLSLKDSIEFIKTFNNLN